MNAELVLRLRQPATLDLEGENVGVELWSTSLAFPRLTPGVRRALAGLEAGAPAGELSRIVASADGPEALATWYYCLGVIERWGGVVYELRDGERTVARAIATTRDFHTGTGVAAERFRWVLSRFAFLHRVDSGLVLESPASGARIELLDAALLPLIGALTTPIVVNEALSAAEQVPADVGKRCLGLLEYCGMLTRVSDSGALAEDRHISRRTWHLSDLLLHQRSRSAFNDSVESTPDVPQAEPVVKPVTAGAPIELHLPDLDTLSATDATFTSVLESRRSIREYGGQPLTKEQLGDFLHRSAGVRRRAANGELDSAETTARPYPGAGACYELEVYVAVARCDGLAAGLYHYDVATHRLEIAAGDTSYVPRLLEQAAIGAQLMDPPQVLVVLAARFDRLMPKYGPGSYALILEDVGVCLQTMYLVATAMHLAPCAVGSGDADLFARAAGMRRYEETSVGELLLGSAPER